MTHKARKTRLPGGPEEVHQVRVKPAGQPLRQLPELDPAQQSSAGPAPECGMKPAGNDGALAELVWKYFADEITEALMEVQQALAPEAKGSIRRADRRKN